MNTILGIIGLLFVISGLLLPPLQALLPRISPVFYFKQRLIRRVQYIIGVIFFSVSLLFGTTTFSWIVCVFIVVFIGMGEIVLIPNKVIPPLDNPRIMDKSTVDLPLDDLIMGVALGEQSRAYPISLLVPHHIVNDQIGNIPIAATYCPACRSGYIFDPLIRGRRLTFEPVSVRRRNMVMKDRETGSVWQHETGICLMGEYKGEQLRLIKNEMCNWKTWATEHPDTTVCFRPDNYKHPSPMGPVFEKLLDHGPKHIVGPGVTSIDRRLEQHDFIIGIIVGGIPKAYQLEKIIKEEMILDKISNVHIVLVYEQIADRVRAFQFTGTKELKDSKGEWKKLIENHSNYIEQISATRQWWLAWSEYHPGSDLYN